MPNIEWLFELHGERLDLQDLAELFWQGSPFVTTVNDRYYLHLPDLPADVDAQNAMAIAETALARMTGIAILTHENHRRVVIRGIATKDIATGELKTSVILTFSIQSRSRVGFACTVTMSDGNEVPGGPTFGQVVLQLADSNDALMRALHLYGALPHNWRELYMVFEAIQEGNGGLQGLIAKQWVRGASIENFKHVANSYKALGAQARHATTKREAPSSKLTLDEARALIRTLLDAWVKALQTKPSATT